MSRHRALTEHGACDRRVSRLRGYWCAGRRGPNARTCSRPGAARASRIKLGRSQFLMGGQVDDMGRFVQPGVVQGAGIGQITADDLARSERAFEACAIEKAADRLLDTSRARASCF